MKSRLLAPVAMGFVCSIALAGCGNSEDAFVVGNPDNVVIEEEAVVESENSPGTDDLMVEGNVTELPDYWPADFPLPEGAVIENVFDNGDSASVYWVFPGDRPAKATQDFSNQLFEAGYEYGQSEGSDDVGQGRFSNETHTVDFMITPLGSNTLQLSVDYGPIS